jgi:hypothetical protein
MTDDARRFSGPWVVTDLAGGVRVVDANGVAGAKVYARDDLVDGAGGGEWLTSDEASASPVA